MEKVTKSRARFVLMPALAIALVFAFMLAGCSQGTGGSQEETTQIANQDNTVSDEGSQEAVDAAAKVAEENKAQAPDDMIKATIGYWGGGVCEMPIYVAYEYGFFQKNGIDPELYVITDDLSVVLNSGAIDAVESQPGDLAAMFEGAPVTWVDTLHTGCYAVATKDGNGIESVADLSGKTVGTSGFTGSGYITLYYEIQKAGGDPSSINWKIYVDNAQEQAMDNGEIDAMLAHDPYCQDVAAKDGNKLLWEQATGSVGEYCCCFLGIYNKTLEANPELAARCAKAFEEATAYATENVKEVTEMSFAKGYLVGSADSQYGNTQTYRFSGGNKEWFDESVDAYWDMERICGNLPDAPDPDKDKAAWDSYKKELTEKYTKYMGSDEKTSDAGPGASES